MSAHRIDVGDSGHVHGMVLSVTDVMAGIADAVDLHGKPWCLMPAHDDLGGWYLSRPGPYSRIVGRVWVRDHTLTSEKPS